MPRPLLCDLVEREHGELSLTLAIESTSADSEPQIIELRGPAVRSLEYGLIAKDQRRIAWRAHPHCVECKIRIARPTNAGLVETADGPRVACKKPCFVRAIARLNPTFSTRAVEARTLASDLAEDR